MYDDQLTRIPKNNEEMWEVLAEQLQMIEMVLFATPVETREAALEAPDKGFMTIRYRGVSEGEDNRDYFLEMGRELCPEVRRIIELREISPAFIQRWGMLQFCHGFIAAHILDDTDPLVSRRAGLKHGRQISRDGQRKWLSHIILGLQAKGKSRKEAEEYAFAIIQGILAKGEYPKGFDRTWFEVMCTYGELASTYSPTKLTRKRMIGLRDEPQDDIPPIPPLP